jgi:hypothetical protein
MQTVANYFRLGCQLSFVCKLLKVTTTTATEVWTRRLNPRRRRRENLLDGSKQTFPCSRSIRTRTRSPGAASDTKTVFPCAWANPMPPGRIRSISTSKPRSFSHKKAQKAQTNLVKIRVSGYARLNFKRRTSSTVAGAGKCSRIRFISKFSKVCLYTAASI